MEVRIKGQMTIADIRQALFEQLHELETKYAVQFSRGATLYINPTNDFGEEVTPRMPGGRELRTLYSMGPYRSAADESPPHHAVIAASQQGIIREIQRRHCSAPQAFLRHETQPQPAPASRIELPH